MIKKSQFDQAELITIGDEIISGHTLDSNAAFIARRLADIGITVRYVTSVGDFPEDMEGAIRTALNRVSLVITTGGLGPTDDDLTKRSLVKVFKRNLVFHEEVWEEIQSRYAGRGIKLSAAVQNQALLPQGAILFKNIVGSAVGIGIFEEGRLIVALPGVPREMKQIVNDELLPYLDSRRGGQAIFVKLIRTTGLGETSLAAKFGQMKIEPGVKLAYLPSMKGVSLRIVARGEDESAARAKVDNLAKQIEQNAGEYIYGYDSDSLESVVGHLLADNDKTLAVAESCTAGQLGMTLTETPGSSAYFLGGVLAYSNEVKTEQLDVDSSLFEEGGDGAVSEKCALAMADGCRKRFRSDFALSITGIAGPDGGNDEKPVGLTYIGLATAHDLICRKTIFSGDREMNRTRAVYSALEMLRRNILDIGSTA